MDKLIIVGTGCTADGITNAAYNALLNADSVVLQTDKLPIYGIISKQRSVVSADACYENAEDFDALGKAVYSVLENSTGTVCYAVFGGGMDDNTARIVFEAAKENGVAVDIITGEALAEKAKSKAGLFGCCDAVTAVDALRHSINPSNGLAVTCIDNYLLSTELKCALCNCYDDETACFFYSLKGEESVKEIQLCDIDRQGDAYDHTCCLLIPPQKLREMKRFTNNQLTDIMQCLRSFEGCPWDREQTHQSLTRYLIEEAYEVIDAIERDDSYALCDELGDVLLQVVFHAQIASESGDFNFTDVATSECKKMIARHPHIFANGVAGSVEQVSNSWEAIKQKEKAQKTAGEIISDVPQYMPALMRAEKLVLRIKSAGLDINDEHKVFDAAVDGIKQGINGASISGLLLATVLLAQKDGIQPEIALNNAVNGFIDGFCKTEKEGDAEMLKQYVKQAFAVKE